MPLPAIGQKKPLCRDILPIRISLKGNPAAKPVPKHKRHELPGTHVKKTEPEQLKKEG